MSVAKVGLTHDVTVRLTGAAWKGYGMLGQVYIGRRSAAVPGGVWLLNPDGTPVGMAGYERSRDPFAVQAVSPEAATRPDAQEIAEGIADRVMQGRFMTLPLTSMSGVDRTSIRAAIIAAILIYGEESTRG